MARHSRAVFAGIPHHVTQRGNHRDRVFFEAADAHAYLCLSHAYFRQHGIEVFAYCLMPNHVHLVLTPSRPDGLHRALRAVHSQFAQRINRMRSLKGHLWQGRYFSSALDTRYFLNAVRYVERNPVRAGLVRCAEDYPWSSAAAHCGLRHDPLIKRLPGVLAGISGWSGWLREEVSADTDEILRQHGSRNLPCGSSEFIAALENTAGRTLRFRPRGGQSRKGK